MTSTLMPSVHSWVSDRKTSTEEDDHYDNSKVLKTPWDFGIKVPREIRRQLQLKADLAELAKGTIVMGRPRRMENARKDGGLSTIGQPVWPPRSTSFDPFADEKHPEAPAVTKLPIHAPIPTRPVGPALRAHFLTKAYFAPLSPAKAAFVESFQTLPHNEANNSVSADLNPAPVEAHADDDDIIVYMRPGVTPPHSQENHYEETTAENRPPVAPFVRESENVAQPARESLLSGVPTALTDEAEPPYPVLHETATHISVTVPTGWAHLRSGPLPLPSTNEANTNTDRTRQKSVEVQKKNESTIRTSNAPWTGLLDVALSNAPAEPLDEAALRRALVPVDHARRVPSLANRIRLLRLLSGV
ncbi:hypothetical protein Hypma_012218 [Hypsizygus marmoreus]|uniref:Uncharacterized protein n=1 Tax=Hypsizygus marmoreus TaxID=39966 RepID=A0A369JFA1_HYPMA|nr:hypothetical protein Hypma_012218 [Hypsizygus marmoreus]